MPPQTPAPRRRPPSAPRPPAPRSVRAVRRQGLTTSGRKISGRTGRAFRLRSPLEPDAGFRPLGCGQRCWPRRGGRGMTMISEVAAAFAAAIGSGRLDLPLPGGGRTWERWAVLAELAGEDLSLARLSKGHTDALAILAELGAGAPAAGSRWGVWAAQPPGPGL